MPVLLFGGATIGGRTFTTAEDTNALLDALKACKINHLDTAAVYPLTNPGASERLIGGAKAGEKGFVIDTKIKIRKEGPKHESLKKEAIDDSVANSLESLGVSQVNVLYCHTPDTVTPIEETAAALHDHVSKGHCKEIGISNYTAKGVEELLSVCDKNGWTKPTVYQGQYNAVCRKRETELLPLLRKHGIKFYAYSPLAGGFLTGNLSTGNDVTNTRYSSTNPSSPFWKKMYDKEAMNAAIKDLHTYLQPHNISLPEASLRWLCHHSALGPEDGLILGATKISQLEQNVADIEKGPLSEEVVGMFEKVWERVKDVAP